MPPFSLIGPRIETLLETGTFSNFGPLEREFRARLAQYLAIDPEQIVTTSNATVGIAGAIIAMSHDAWEVPAWTFAATPAAVRLAGVEFHFVDVSDSTPWKTSTSLRTQAHRGQVLVPAFGHGFREKYLDKIPSGTVVDSAASLANVIQEGLPNMDDESAVVFSLHATKPLGIGEGGLVVCGSTSLASEIRSWTNFGFRGSRTSKKWGINAKLSEFSCAIGLAVLDNISQELEEWAIASAHINECSTSLPLARLDPLRSTSSPYWVVLFDSPDERRESIERLAEERIETRLWWGEGAHRMPAYVSDSTKILLSATDYLASRYLGLPKFRGIEKHQVENVVEVISEALSRK